MSKTWYETPARFMVQNGLYQKANAFCRVNGIEEYRISELRPNGPDDHQVYYLHDYYPKNMTKDRMSQKIRELKMGSEEAAYDFGMEILGVIKLLYELSGRSEYHLVCIPTHTADTTSRMNRCIDYAIALNDVEGLSIIRDTIVIKRVSDVNPSHAGPALRPSEIEHRLSVLTYGMGYNFYDRNVILLDDVTTTGRQMDMARRELLYLGCRKERLFQLVLGKTVSGDAVKF